MLGMFSRPAAGVCVAAISLFSLSTAAFASSVNVDDVYYGGRNVHNTVPNNGGGTNSTNFPNQDVIANAGNNAFQISGATLTRTLNSLEVVIHTAYVGSLGVNSLVGSLGTTLGALFLGNGAPVYNNGINSNPVFDATGHYTQDTFTKDTGRFDYALSPTYNGTTKVGTVYSLNGTGSDVVLSNYPTSIDNYRANQAVNVNGTAQLANGITGTWSLTGTSIVFNLNNIFGQGKLDDTFTFAWAMSCANDIIMNTVTLVCDDCGNTNEVPVPAALPLFAGGLGVFGFLAHRRKRRAAQQTA